MFFEEKIVYFMLGSISFVSVFVVLKSHLKSIIKYALNLFNVFTSLPLFTLHSPGFRRTHSEPEKVICDALSEASLHQQIRTNGSAQTVKKCKTSHDHHSPCSLHICVSAIMYMWSIWGLLMQMHGTFPPDLPS